MNKVKHFLSIKDLNAKEIWQVILLAKKLKNQNNVIPAEAGIHTMSEALASAIDSGSSMSGMTNKKVQDDILKGKNVVLLFEKPSLRTKLSFDIGVSQLGGHPIYFGKEEVGLGQREAVSDVAKVISSIADLVIARVFSHKDLEKFAISSQIPVLNALSDKEHPCQTLADLLTIYEIKGKLKGLKVTFMGDSKNNVAYSLKLACDMLGINFEKNDPANADVVYTDTWVSMGDEAKVEEKLKQFQPFQVNQKVMELAKPDAIFMHCLPAHRGQEVTEDVIDGAQSVIFKQAENRLHAQKALLIYLSARDEVKDKSENLIKSDIKGGGLYGYR